MVIASASSLSSSSPLAMGLKRSVAVPWIERLRKSGVMSSARCRMSTSRLGE
jgi:hypothetical protein